MVLLTLGQAGTSDTHVFINLTYSTLLYRYDNCLGTCVCRRHCTPLPSVETQLPDASGGPGTLFQVEIVCSIHSSTGGGSGCIDLVFTTLCRLAFEAAAITQVGCLPDVRFGVTVREVSTLLNPQRLTNLATYSLVAFASTHSPMLYIKAT